MDMKAVAIMIVAAVAATGCARGLLAPQWGVQDGRLASCEGLRGCVSSQAETAEHLIAPVVYVSTRVEARADMIAVLQSFRGAQIVSSHPVYLRVEFTSRDVPGAGYAFDIAEFYFPQDEKVIHVRSTPRRNMPDSGENRNRIETIRTRFISLQEQRR
jgi:uncharacterized protein (DUF1499 family)